MNQAVRPDATARSGTGAAVGSIALSLLVIAVLALGWSALIGVLFLLAWVPGGLVLWFLVPVGLTTLAILAAFFAVRSRRLAPRIVAGAAIVCALASFGLPVIAQIMFARSFG
ncbi:membrane glycosyltransferase [Microbacterium testaceum StLB037]|uniref:Membrane glycosyltransferase n=1 Tax=Microbacterium testaceum (strain StLB037) TaxID=979556 RepID=E8N714_MICTS|nr:hypothetical protein [Microbacterium testaceum]BAJ74231.1 membrane glycosyltransferase [Microbacterium testaceum StLB037]